METRTNVTTKAIDTIKRIYCRLRISRLLLVLYHRQPVYPNQSKWISAFNNTGVGNCWQASGIASWPMTARLTALKTN